MKRDTLDDAPASGSVGPSGSSSTDVTVLPRSNRPLYLLGAVLGFGLFLVANGWALNDAAIFEGGTLEFRADGGPASVTPRWRGWSVASDSCR